jgi:enamine deaminase RidA (YjgF/YER057c/UK114 family)
MSILTKHNPEHVIKPYAAYSQGVEVPPNARWLHVAGQVGVKRDGSLAGDAEAQVQTAWQNVLEVLAAANMAAEDLVRVNIYITDPKDVEINREYYGRMTNGARPAVTMVTVKRLSNPDWSVEIEAVAAKA